MLFQQRTQEIRVFDMRNWQNAECVQEYSPSTGVLIPLYDDDTKLLFLAGKGTNKLIITEIQSRTPIISPGMLIIQSTHYIRRFIIMLYTLMHKFLL